MFVDFSELACSPFGNFMTSEQSDRVCVFKVSLKIGLSCYWLFDLIIFFRVKWRRISANVAKLACLNF